MKRGQLQLSFGMIFSIILIIVFIGVAIYAIVTFLHWGNCGQIGLYYNELQNEATKAWQGEISNSIFEGNVPSGVEKVCFGNLTQIADSGSREEQLFLKKYVKSRGNIFIYPPEKACDQQLASTTIEHAKIDRFFCVKTEKGKIKVKLIKEVSDNEVSIAP